jgi:hypothetical protein
METKIRTVRATRYVTPLREGGSLPAIIEADDEGMYVLKFRGAGQGPKALIAEYIAGQMARAVGLPIPELVFVELDAELARTEPDPEIQELIRASAGLNLALEYLPGSVMFDPVAEKPESDLASAIVWFDSYITNVDRTAKNTNMLMWQRKLWLIDHGAALYFHHASGAYKSRSQDAFPMVNKHVLLPFANSLQEIDQKLTQGLSSEVIEKIIHQIPESWLAGASDFEDTVQHKRAYSEYFIERLKAPHRFLEEAIRARSSHL